jgi:uncharacterized protein (TIGR02302 family)
MVSRSHRALMKSKTLFKGRPQLTLAHLIINIEHRLRVFLHPLMLGGIFIALAWLGVFTSLYPWAHLIALTLFVIYFFKALGSARTQWKTPDTSLAKRRVEEASGLSHRPLDAIEDRPMTTEPTQVALWQAHRDQAEKKILNLGWPKWALNLAPHDPFGIRYLLLILISVSLVNSWGMLGDRFIAAINPALGKWHLTRPALDAWITPPTTTQLPPIMIATPAGLRHDKDVLDIAEGSKLSVHLAEKDGVIPTLEINNKSQDFVAEDDKDYSAEAIVQSGQSITLRRGWQTLGKWKIRVIPDLPPQIAFAETPSITERKTIRLAINASDDYGVNSIQLRVTPRESLPGYDNNAPVDIALGGPQARTVKRIAYEDLTAHPWAGLGVKLQLIATDTAGQQTLSDPVDFVLPERDFVQPLARALVDERKKILQSPNDMNVRNEAANVMAGIAHQPASYQNDPVVMMVLRAGAVRLVLDGTVSATTSVSDMIWQAAIRIEDGNISTAEQNLRQAQKDLADALDHNASERDVQKIIDRMHQALAQYMAELSTRNAPRSGPTEDLSQLLGTQSNMLSPDDLQQMLDHMRQLSASGSRDGARDELIKLQQLLENLRTGPVQLSEEQRAALQNLKNLKALAGDQKKLLDQTFQSAVNHDLASNKGFATNQNQLHSRLTDLMAQMKQVTGDNLPHSADAMGRAEKLLQGGSTRFAVESQNEALKALQDAVQSMQQDLRQSFFMLPKSGMGMAGADPFGRGKDGYSQDDDGIKIPDQMEVRRVRAILDELQRRSGDQNRPKPERDYIDRLLQNF